MRAIFVTVLAVSLALLALATTVSAQQAAPPPYRVIVHPRNPVASVDRQFLEDAFLKKTASWPQDGVIRPADLAPSSAVRRRFCREVLARSVAAVRAYWQQRIFSGRDVPPPEFDSDEKVVDYVLKHQGAVGYVSGTADLRGTKAILVRR